MIQKNISSVKMQIPNRKSICCSYLESIGQRPTAYVINFITCFTLLFFCQLASADLIYNLVDHEILDHALSGTVTVADTAVDDGLLMAEEILGWQITVAGSFVNIQLTEADSGASVEVSGVVNINPTSIKFDTTAVDGIPNRLIYINSTGNAYVDRNEFENLFFQTVSRVEYSEFNLSIEGSGELDRFHAIASVPEPCSAILCLGLVGFGLVSRRKVT